MSKNTDSFSLAAAKAMDSYKTVPLKDLDRCFFEITQRAKPILDLELLNILIIHSLTMYQDPQIAILKFKEAIPAYIRSNIFNQLPLERQQHPVFKLFFAGDRNQ